MNDKEYITITNYHKVIIRENDREIRVFVHRMNSELQEKLPLAYLLGTNALILEAPIVKRGKE